MTSSQTLTFSIANILDRKTRDTREDKDELPNQERNEEIRDVSVSSLKDCHTDTTDEHYADTSADRQTDRHTDHHMNHHTDHRNHHPFFLGGPNQFLRNTQCFIQFSPFLRDGSMVYPSSQQFIERGCRVVPLLLGQTLGNGFGSGSPQRRTGHPYQGRSSPKRKKPRTSFSRFQIVELEKRFRRQKYLASTERTSLAKVLKMTDAQVKTWFQNRRTKWRRQTTEDKETERQQFGNRCHEFE